MSDYPIVSVCMITYGHEKFIKQAVINVLNQKVPFKYELIIANDCSPDNTETIIKEIISSHHKGNLINYYSHKTNVGMMSNFGFALKKCNGKYIALCEGDDYWSDSNKLKRQIDFLEQHNDYVLVGYNAKFNINGKETDELVRKTSQEYIDYTTSDLISRNPFVTCGVVFKNIKMEKIDTILQHFIVGDKAVFTLLSFEGKCRFYSEPLGFYRKHENSVTHNNRKAYEPYKKELINRIKHAEFWNDFSKKMYNDEVREVRKYRSKILTTMAFANMDFKTAIHYSQFVDLKDINKGSSRFIIRCLKINQKLISIFS